MTVIQKATSLLKQFGADQNGTIAVMLGLSALPLLLAAGAAIDFGRYNNAQTQVQASLDAGALAGAAAEDASDAERVKMANTMFDANWKASGSADLSVKASFKVEEDRLKSTAEVTMPTTFMALAGVGDLTATLSAEVGIAQDKKAEVVLVLDYSGSMWETVGTQVKYIAMKDAATALVNDLAKTDPDKVKFGLVPFSHKVYTSMPASYIVGGGGGTWTGCTMDRASPYNTSAGTPGGSNDTKWNPAIETKIGEHGCSGFVDHHLKTVDLTDKFSDITGQLAVMTPFNYTHIALGVEFGYHMLSPNAPFTNGAAFSDKKTKKFLVVLTDGDQTESGFRPDGKRTKKAAEDNLEKLCANAKEDDITIITMALALGSGPTVNRLRDCSTEPSKHFFTPDTAADLTKAFDSIKNAITAEVYLSK